jgi:hypothetical protein
MLVVICTSDVQIATKVASDPGGADGPTPGRRLQSTHVHIP